MFNALNELADLDTLDERILHVRVALVSGRKITTVENFSLEESGTLVPLLKEMKRSLNCNGTIKSIDKGNVIQLSGDHRTAVATILEKKGYTSKVHGY